MDIVFEKKYPLIHVIIPVYNVEEYLKDCLDSLRKQNYSHFNAILVDDGSTDESGRICDEYCIKDERFFVIHQENRGLSGARNSGIDKVFESKKIQSEYIAFLDSDDCYDIDFLKIMLDGIQLNDADISMCAGYSSQDDYLDQTNNVIWRTISGKDACSYLSDGSYVVVWNKLYKSEIFRNLRFPVKKKFEDEWVAHEYMYNAKKICITDRRLYFYRKRNGSITDKSKKQCSLDAVDALMERIKFFNSKNEFELASLAAERLEQICVEYLKSDKVFSVEDRIKLRARLRFLIREYHFSPFQHPNAWIYSII